MKADGQRQDHTSFHEEPLSTRELSESQTRPYRWHMDAPLYEHLPGFVTSLLCHEVPELPDQKICFPDGSEKAIAAGATACKLAATARTLVDEFLTSYDSLLRSAELRPAYS